VSTPLGALALLPPEPPRPSSPAVGRALKSIERPERLRRTPLAVGMFGALFPVACVAAAPYLDDVVIVFMVICWALLVPGCGVALLLLAGFNRTRADLNAVLAGVLTLVAAAALVKPAARAGSEAFVSSHAPELERGAARWRREWRPMSDTPVDGGLRVLGIRAAAPGEGGIRFTTDAPFGPDLFYADPMMNGQGESCDRLTPIGGRWYLWECPDAEASD